MTCPFTVYSDVAGGHGLGYQETLMYGRYSHTLGDLAREEAARQRHTLNATKLTIINFIMTGRYRSRGP